MVREREDANSPRGSGVLLVVLHGAVDAATGLACRLAAIAVLAVVDGSG